MSTAQGIRADPFSESPTYTANFCPICWVVRRSGKTALRPFCTAKARTARGFMSYLTTCPRRLRQTGASGRSPGKTVRTKRRNEGPSIGPSVLRQTDSLHERLAVLKRRSRRTACGPSCMLQYQFLVRRAVLARNQSAPAKRDSAARRRWFSALDHLLCSGWRESAPFDSVRRRHGWQKTSHGTAVSPSGVRQ